jgi:hypothetical protein
MINSKLIENFLQTYNSGDGWEEKNPELMNKIEWLLEPVFNLENFVEQTQSEKDNLHWYSIFGIPVAYMHDNYPCAYINENHRNIILNFQKQVEPNSLGLSNCLRLENNCIKTNCYIPADFRVTVPFYKGKLAKNKKSPLNVAAFFLKETEDVHSANCRWGVLNDRNFIVFDNEFATNTTTYAINSTKLINADEELIVLKQK